MHSVLILQKNRQNNERSIFIDILDIHASLVCSNDNYLLEENLKGKSKGLDF